MPRTRKSIYSTTFQMEMYDDEPAVWRIHDGDLLTCTVFVSKSNEMELTFEPSLSWYEVKRTLDKIEQRRELLLTANDGMTFTNPDENTVPSRR